MCRRSKPPLPRDLGLTGAVPLSSKVTEVSAVLSKIVRVSDTSRHIHARSLFGAVVLNRLTGTVKLGNLKVCRV